MPEQKLPHLLVSGFTWEAPYQSPNNGGGRRPSIPRARVAHGTKLLRQLRRLVRELPDIVSLREDHDLPAHAGIAVALEIKPKGALDFQGIEWKKDRIEVLSVIEHPDSEIVVLHVPDGHIGALERRIQAYLEKNAKSGKPQNLALVTAAELASKGQIAVFPVGGGWKDWKEAGQWDTEVRYSLVLSLEVAEQLDADFYTPIKTQIDAATVAQQIEVDDGAEEE